MCYSCTEKNMCIVSRHRFVKLEHIMSVILQWVEMLIFSAYLTSALEGGNVMVGCTTYYFLTMCFPLYVADVSIKSLNW